MNKDEALKLALEALEKVTRSNQSDHQAEIAEEAINVLRLVIDAENISSKPVAWEQFYPEMGKPKLAYLSPTESPDNACYIPPQRTWVGLTDEDFLEACQIAERGNYLVAFQRIQAKLKEKNT